MRILTRKSALAMWQANYVAQKLLNQDPSLEITIIPMVTEGDKLLDRPLYQVGGKALFVKELQQALLAREGDIAIHSLKDVPFALPEALKLGAILTREDPRDAWVCPKGVNFMDLPPRSVVGTSSLRRALQLQQLRNDLNYQSIRGNVGTRIEKCRSGHFDGTVLAFAGLKRLGMESAITEVFSVEDCLPSAGQGAIAIEIRRDNHFHQNAIDKINDAQSSTIVLAERRVNEIMQSSCKTPLAAYGTIIGKEFRLTGKLGCPITKRMLSSCKVGPISAGKTIAEQVVADLMAQGGKEILEACQKDEN